MPNTTNYNWDIPADTDLVKDGAAAMRTLGNSIDTTTKNLNPETTLGDIAYRSATANTNTRLPIGTAGQVLTVSSGVPAWVTPQIGDITAVTAGTGLSGGGTSGDVTLTNTVATAYDAKGDLVVGTGADNFSKLTAGSNGDTLVADSSTTTGLRWQADWNTGKNKIINGDFGINQRAFTSATTSGTFGFDRWATYRSNSSFTFSAQTFTPGTAPVAGYEGINFARGANTTDSTSGEFCLITQRMEDVRTFAGQTVTVSFWAKASSGTPKLGVELRQTFGGGGSAAVDGTGQSVTLSTSWARYSVTISVPSISGKTVGTSSYLELILWFSAGSTYATRSGSVGNQTATIDFWGVQAEAGSVATPFTTATGTLAGELAACQRYYQVANRNDAWAQGQHYSATAAYCPITFIVEMRGTPTITLAPVGNAAGNINFLTGGGAYPTANGTLAALTITRFGFQISGTGYTGFSTGVASVMYANGATNVYTASAEL